MRHRLSMILMAVMSSVTASGAQGQAHATIPLACPYTHAINADRTVEKWLGTTYVNTTFYFGVGHFGSPGGSTSGVYNFGNLINSAETYAYSGAWANFSCLLYGTWHPPAADTTWEQLYKENSTGGTLTAVYHADCETDLGCDDQGDEGGGGGGGGGEQTCYYLVAADASGAPLTDEAGNYYILADLGCR